MSKRRNKMSRKGRKFIKDRAIVKFIHQHYVREEIYPSKVPISSFSDILKSDEEDSRAFRAKYCKYKSEELNSENAQTFPTFSLSILDVIKMEGNFVPSAHFSSSLFQ